MNRSIIIAFLIAVAAVAWIASGRLGNGSGPQPQKEAANLSALNQEQAVRVSQIKAEAHERHLVLRGSTEPERAVDLKAETKGIIVKLLVEKGSDVAAGDIIARLSPEDRLAQLEEAKALREQRRIEYGANVKLADKGFRAQTQLAGAKASLEAADAGVKKAEIALENLVISAPFSGRLEARPAELGSYLEVGQMVARIVDLDPLRIVGFANEQDVRQIELGTKGQVRFVGGGSGEAVVSFIAASAESSTRTFRVELTMANPDATVPAGITAEMILPRKSIVAQRISPAVLTLADNGKVGVRIVDDQGLVAFREISIIDESRDEMWVTGLPELATVIVVGQEFVQDGEKVKAIDADTLQPLALGSAQ